MSRTRVLLAVAVLAVPRSAAPQGGTPLGPEFRVNTFTPSDQRAPDVAFDPAGTGFMVVWQSYGQDGWHRGIFGQRYAPSGAPLGPEFRVNTYTTFSQSYPSIAASSGTFVVVWMSYSQHGSSDGVFGQRYAASGVPLGPEFRVNTYTTGIQSDPALAGSFLSGPGIFFAGEGQDGLSDDVFGQRYDASGVPFGPEFRVNTHTTDGQFDPSTAMDSSGNFVVVWTSALQDGSDHGVFGQRYAASGAPLGPEFRVNTFTTSYQFGASAAADPPGSFVVVWQSLGQDGSGMGIFGQRYSQIVPVELMHFRVE